MNANVQIIPANFVGVISREKLEGGGRHFGVLLPGGQVVDFSPHGVRFMSLAAFLQRRPGKTERAIPMAEYRQAVWRAQNAPGAVRPYHVVDFNCEHFANYIAGVEAESGQINFLVFLGFAGLAWFAFSKG